MSMSMFFVLTMTLVLFSGFTVYFGLSNPAIANALQGPINCDINNSPPQSCAYPQYSPPVPSNITYSQTTTVKFPACLLWIPSCFNGAVGTIANTGQAIWNGLALIGYSIGYIAIFGFIFFNKLTQGIFLIYGITNIMSTDYGVFGLQYIFLGFLMFYVVFGISLIKPAGSTSQ